MQEVKSSINKRASKRHTYLPQAFCEAQDIRQRIQIRDISQSGMQFFSHSFIQTNAPVCATWEDPVIGSLAPFLLIVRNIRQPYDAVFQYCYGSRFVNLRQETREGVEKLLLQTRNEERNADEKLITKITPEFLIEIIKQGRPFLQSLFKGDGFSKTFVRFTRECKPYEKNSFEKNDDIAHLIQKLTTHNFHCNLLNMATPFISQNHAQGKEFYRVVPDKLESISYIIAESNKFMASMDGQNIVEEARTSFKSMIHESTNRLFHTRFELLTTFMETYVFSEDEKNPMIKKIMDEYFLHFPQAKMKSLLHSRQNKSKPRIADR